MPDKANATRWAEIGDQQGWTMPSAPLWKRLPLIRHVRAVYHSFRLTIWEEQWTALGYCPNDNDDWVTYGMWRGKERPQTRHNIDGI